MGYEKPDLVSHVPFEFHHHDDVEANLECSRGCKFFLIHTDKNIVVVL